MDEEMIEFAKRSLKEEHRNGHHDEENCIYAVEIDDDSDVIDCPFCKEED